MKHKVLVVLQKISIYPNGNFVKNVFLFSNQQNFTNVTADSGLRVKVKLK